MTQELNTVNQAALTALRKQGAEDVIFDKRAIMIGIILSTVIAGGALAWRMAVNVDKLKQPPLNNFEFSVAEHSVEDLKLREPQRDILQERPENAQLDNTATVDERPDIHMTTQATDAAPASEFIQSPNTNIADQGQTIEINPDEITVQTKDMEIQDNAPAHISETSAVTEYAISPIAATVTDGAADYIKYDEPAPPDRPGTYFVNRAQRPGRPVKNLLPSFGDQSSLGTGQLGPVNINLNGTGRFFRTAIKSGSVEARSAVDGALHWLAMHQEPNGSWDALKYDGTQAASMGVTGLATLALMGGGHTIRKGEYRRNVQRAIEEIIRNQKPDGSLFVGGGIEATYTHAICTIALCEAYGRTHEERIGQAAQKAIQFCEKAVCSDGGWRYQPKAGPSDMSVSGWYIMALKTAKLAQIKFDSAVFSQALSFVDSVTDQGGSADSNGAVTYLFAADQRYDNSHPALTCAGMMVRQFSGMGVKSQLLLKGAELTKRLPPTWGHKDFYYWYYATYAMHNMGGEYRIWWNQKIQDVLLTNQAKDADNAGSWDPKGDVWGSHGGGRVLTTALGALCLEVYYRYSEACNSFGVAPDLDELLLENP